MKTFLRGSAVLTSLCAIFLLTALPAAAAPWSPATEISAPGSSAEGGEVGIDGAGNAVAVFRDSNGIEHVEAAEKPAGGGWQAPVDLSSSPYPPEFIQIEIDPAGDAVVVWNQFNGSHEAIEAAVRSAGGPWQPPIEISEAGVESLRPQIAIAPSGAAVVVWEGWVGSPFFPGSESFVQAAAMTAAGTWGAPVDVSSPAPEESLPEVAFDSGGTATAVWQHRIGNAVIEVAELAPGGSWGPGSVLSLPGGNAIEAHVAGDQDGDMVATWAQYDGSDWIVQSSLRTAGGPWQVPVDISNPGHSSLSPRLAVDSAGDAVAAWETFQGSNFNAEAATGLDGVWEPPVALSPPGVEVTEPEVALDPGGDAVVVWTATGTPEVATKTAAGAWQVGMPVPGYPADEGRVAVDPRGNAIIISRRDNFSGPNSAVQATSHEAARLTIAPAGTGSGTVSSAPAGIQCGSACAAQFDDEAVVTLTATAAAGSDFTGWSGACAGTGPCTVTMSAARSVTATFTAEAAPPGPAPPGPVTPVSNPRARPLAEPAADACFAVGASAGTYVPAPVPGRTIAGVRARVSVGAPSQVFVDPSLGYVKDGKPHSVDLAPLSFHAATARNLRLPLPANLRGALPLGTRVELTLRISATADSTPGCGSEAVGIHRSKVRVVQVLATAQPGVG